VGEAPAFRLGGLAVLNDPNTIPDKVKCNYCVGFGTIFVDGDGTGEIVLRASQMKDSVKLMYCDECSGSGRKQMPDGEVL
jgi:hypothetical protein